MIHKTAGAIAAGLFTATVSIALAAGTATADPQQYPNPYPGTPEGSNGQPQVPADSNSTTQQPKSEREKLLERCKTLPTNYQWKCYRDADQLPH
ncbi:hypothetical protein [Nocardia cyriacigeorgica]|uniref:hypothetical protein n=2 Tax=Nocardia cyriacigeorgica TaxID=135487 RepID=UPI001895A217|nr:hypothetical protein [Nocardia cyriacigeorgica]MBF6414850.1 hypothetical protein [Nocardia cyriacigeorgica]